MVEPAYAGHDETLNEHRDITRQQQHDMSPEWAFDFVSVHRHSLHSDAVSISSMESLSMDFFDQSEEVSISSMESLSMDFFDQSDEVTLRKHGLQRREGSATNPLKMSRCQGWKKISLEDEDGDLPYIRRWKKMEMGHCHTSEDGKRRR